jgi:hypothetical protein
MQSLRLSLFALPLMLVGAACSQTGPNLGSGTGGAGGGMGMGGMMVSIDQIAGTPNANGDKLEDSWMLFPCYAQQAQDCITNPPGTACPNQDTSLQFEAQGLQIDQSYTVGGMPGVMYNVTFTINGITEAKYYENGVRADGDQPPANPDLPTGINMLYTGGDPVNFENYNIYKLTVFDTNMQELQHYYLNSMPTGSAMNFENHDTFPEGYTATIPVMGGGTIGYHQSDRNCHAIDNCGIGSRSATCAVTAGRNIPNEPSLVIPSMYLGMDMNGFNTRNGANQPFHAQGMHLTVTAVEVMPPSM